MLRSTVIVFFLFTLSGGLGAEDSKTLTIVEKLGLKAPGLEDLDRKIDEARKQQDIITLISLAVQLHYLETLAEMELSQINSDQLLHEARGLVKQGEASEDNSLMTRAILNGYMKNGKTSRAMALLLVKRLKEGFDFGFALDDALSSHDKSSALLTWRSIERIYDATTSSEKTYHIVFRQIIQSTDQHDWWNGYGADVFVYRNGQEVAHFEHGGSTLPNSWAPTYRSSDYEYALVTSTCSFPTELRGRFYKGERLSGHSKFGDCIIINDGDVVPTLNISDVNEDEAKILNLVTREGDSDWRYATEIFIHNGQKNAATYGPNPRIVRGSAGCLTINPEIAEELWRLIPPGAYVSIEILRGLPDPQMMTSRCY